MADPLELTARAEAVHFWFRGFRQFVAPVLRDAAAGRQPLRIIDCGCGTGRNFSLLRPYGPVVGFDRAVNGARGERASGARVIPADIARIPFQSNTFDLVTAFDVLQCLEHDAAAVAEMARIVKPGGRLVLTMAALEMLRGDHAEAWREFRRYTPAMARRLVEGAGLRTERTAFLFASVFPLLLVRRAAQRMARPLRGPRPAADITVPPAVVNAVLTWLVRAEAALAQRVRMPVGSSLLVVARKPQEGEVAMTMDADVTRERMDEPTVWAWLAAGAVAAGAIGAIIGCARSCGRAEGERLRARPRAAVDAPLVTPPHGDVLHVE